MDNSRYKFRAWDKTSKTMIQNYAYVGSYGELYVTQFHSEAYSDKRCPDLVLLQYTGRKDKDEKEIYEGDVIEGTLDNFSFPTMGVIVYDSYWSAYGNKNEAGFTLLHKIKNPKIIGNIYENPELL